MYWRENNKRKSQWSMRWLGAGIVIGHLQPLRSTRLHHSKRHRSQKLRSFHQWQRVGDLAHFISRILYQSVGDPTRCILRLLFRPQRLHSFGGAQVFCMLCVHFEDSETNNQIPRKRVRNDLGWLQLRRCQQLGKKAVISLLDLTEEARCSMKSTRIGATRFSSQDVRQEKRFILLQSLQRISVCCLGRHVNGRNGR